MQIRMPIVDFTGMPARWMPRNPEMGHQMNGVSVGTPDLERFLNKVMAKARQEIVGDDPESVRLRADIKTFIRQESCHTALHMAFNDALVADGYPGLREIQKEVAAHYDRLLQTKSLKFLVAYCEGFETLGPPVAKAWLDGLMDSLFEDAHPAASMMFRWHVMEEFEHRNVVFDTFKKMKGSYFLRVYGYFYQMYHFTRLGRIATRYMIQMDRAKMTEAEIAASRQRAREASKLLKGPALRGMLKTLMPWYSPHRLKFPDRYQAVVNEVEQKWGGAPNKAGQLSMA
jgi:predicted metal-dependent hydrolase